MIRITALENDVYLVEVEGSRATSHRVTLTASECRRIGGDGVAPEKLLDASFRFLLEREPNTSILGSFELKTIGRYFPNFEDAIRDRLDG